MGGADKVKLWLATFSIIGVVYVIGYGEASTEILFGISIAGLIFSAALIYFSQAGHDFSRFLRDSGVELKKVVWPSKQETMQLTVVVFAILLLITFFLWLVDLMIVFFLDLLI